jgi:ribose transport system permease protein
MSYGVILVLSLLLTLLVPIIGRHISFVSPWSAFIVLAAVVAAIMLQVATSPAYVAADGVAAAQSADLLTRYLLVPPAETPSAGLGLSLIQKAAFGAAALLVAFTFSARLINAEAKAVRMGVFLYAFVAVMLLLLFVVLSGEGGAAAIGGDAG